MPTLSDEPFAVDGCGNTIRVGSEALIHGHLSERATILRIDPDRRDYNTLTVVDGDGYEFAVGSSEAVLAGADQTWFFGWS